MNGFELMMEIGIWMGIGLYAAKLFIVHLMIKATENWWTTKFLRKRIPLGLRLVALDIGFGYLSSHAFGGFTNMGIIAMSTFAVCSAIYCLIAICFDKFKRWKGEIVDKARKENGIFGTNSRNSTPSWYPH